MKLLALIVVAVLASPARAEPSDRTLVYVGLGFGVPTYLVGVSLHEGSHALAATLVGGEVLEVHLFPPGRDPKAGKFRFGWTYVRGLETKRQRILFYVAPKLTDAILLGGFAALVFSDGWPENRYGQLALTVFATGLWVDFAKDVVLFSNHNDVVKVLSQWCLTGWRQLPARLVYAGAIAGLGLIVAHGYRRTFDDRADDAMSPRIVPVVGASF